MSARSRYRNFRPARIAVVAVVLVLVAVFGPPLTARQWIGAVAALALSAALTAVVRKRRGAGE